MAREQLKQYVAQLKNGRVDNGVQIPSPAVPTHALTPATLLPAHHVASRANSPVCVRETPNSVTVLLHPGTVKRYSLDYTVKEPFTDHQVCLGG